MPSAVRHAAGLHSEGQGALRYEDVMASRGPHKGVVLSRSFFPDAFVKTFWNRAAAVGECWEWQGSLSRNGYGAIAFRGRTFIAHRLAYALMSGDVPEQAVVLHSCDNKRCVFPEHLSLGDQKENARQAVERGLWRPRTAKRKVP